MAAVLSDLISNIINVTKNPVSRVHARLRMSVSQVAVAAADNDGTIYPMLRLRANDRLQAAMVYNTAITGGTAYSLGVYPKTAWVAASAPTAVASACYIDTISMAAERDALNEALTDLFGNGTNAIASTLQGTRIWEQAGVAADPGAWVEYDICWTAATVGTGAGTITCQFLYTAGD